MSISKRAFKVEGYGPYTPPKDSNDYSQIFGHLKSIAKEVKEQKTEKAKDDK